MVPESSHCLHAQVGTHRFRASVAISAVALFAFTGCGKADDGRIPVFPVRGQIEFKGQPPNGAFVVLHPKNGASSGVPSPRAMVGPDGAFALSTYDGHDGAPQGAYVLTVQWHKLVKQGGDVVSGPNVLPAKYASPRTSDIKITVASNENQLKPIQLR